MVTIIEDAKTMIVWRLESVTYLRKPDHIQIIVGECSISHVDDRWRSSRTLNEFKQGPSGADFIEDLLMFRAFSDVTKSLGTVFEGFKLSIVGRDCRRNHNVEGLNEALEEVRRYLRVLSRQKKRNRLYYKRLDERRKRK